MELLAPAGSIEALKAAVSAGADAVYFGGQTLNARVFGKNFTDEEVEQAAFYCKSFGVKAYLTLNTLTDDREKENLIPFLQKINAIPIDGVIVQDPGLARMIKRTAPQLPVHASTQMTIHSLDGVRQAAELGFSRVVLSRELPQSEIRYITQNSPVEIEAFMHGALCMCYSGQCYLSAVIGERSGNRGKCAQPCRKPYGNGYELSLKDLCMAQNFTEFLGSGVYSFKIEGRMKSPSYVAGVVSVYRRLIDEKRNATPHEMAFLAELFSREGFTNGYFQDAIGKKMFGVRTQADKEKSREVDLEIRERKIKVVGAFYATQNQNMRFTLTAGNKTYTAEGDKPQLAQKAAATAADCQKQLSKLGNTRFVMDEFTCQLEDGLFIPVGALNHLRRACTEGLEQQIIQFTPRVFTPKPFTAENVEQPTIRIASCLTAEQAQAVQNLVNVIRLPLWKIKENIGNKTQAVLPAVIWDREKQGIVEQLKTVQKLGIHHVVCRNLGQIQMCKEMGFTVHGDTGLNIFNAESVLQAKELGLSSVTLSFELNGGQVRDMPKALPCNSVVYGRYPVMLTENCILKNRGECVNYQGVGLLKDETGRDFPVFCEPQHRNVIYNAVPLYLADKPADLPKCGQVFLFTCESGEQAAEILNNYKNNKPVNGQFTRGFIRKKV